MRPSRPPRFYRMAMMAPHPIIEFDGRETPFAPSACGDSLTALGTGSTLGCIKARCGRFQSYSFCVVGEVGEWLKPTVC